MKKPQRTSSKNSQFSEWDAFAQQFINESVDPDYDGLDEYSDEEAEDSFSADASEETPEDAAAGTEEDAVVIELPKEDVPTELIKGILQGLGKEAAQALVDEIFADEETDETEEQETADESEPESEEDSDATLEEPAEEDEDLSSHFMDEDEETIEEGGASQNVKANGSVGAPTRTTHNGAYENGKTTKSVYDKTVSGTGTPANSVGAPSRTTHSGSYENGKTAKSKLTPGKHIFEV